MNRGIMLKAARELFPVTLVLGLIVMAAETILAYVMPTFSGQFSVQMMRVELVRNMLKAMLGSDLAHGIGPEMFVAIPWVHPVVLAIIWAHAIICCTRVPAGEVDRGTIDVLVALPVTRWRLYCSETIVWLASGLALIGFAVIGNMLGSSRIRNPVHVEPIRVAAIVTNLFCLYACVGGAAWFFSAVSDRKGRAMGVVFVLVAASFLLNYLAQFWEPAQRLAPLGILRYYRPLFILRDGGWASADLLVLTGFAFALWSTGAIIFTRRDLSTL